MNNLKIRFKLIEKNKKLWWLAKAMGISESTITRKLRDELSEEEQARIVQLIEQKAGEENGSAD